MLSNRRLLLTTVLLALVAAVIVPAAVADLGRDEVAKAASADQDELRDAYRLADTWDGNHGQAAPGSVLFPAGIDVDDSAVILVDRGNDRVQMFSPAGDFQAAWGQAGTELGDLDDPRDVSLDGQHAYVTDRANARVVVYARDGRALEAWTAPGLVEPWGIAASGGRVYVSNRSAGEVVVFEGGAVVTRWGGLDDPMGIDVGADGKVYVADREASMIRIFLADGTPAGTLRTNLSPSDVDVDQRADLYVQSEGAILWYPFGSPASRQALYFVGMQGVAVHERLGVFATVARMDASNDPSHHGVMKYKWQPGNEPAQPWGPARGFPPGRLFRPRAAQAGASGKVWVVDEWPRLQSFDASGRPVDQLVPQTTVGIAGVDVAETADGELLVGEWRRLVRVDGSGAIRQAVRLGEMRQGTWTSFWLTGLAWRESGLRRATVLDSATVHARDYGVTATVRHIGSQALAPGTTWSLYWDVAVPKPNPSNLMYAVNRGARRVEVSRGNSRIATWEIDGVPTRASVGPDGHVFVLTVDGLVHKLDTQGKLVALWDAAAFSAGGSEVVDVAVDADGRVYTVDREANTIHVWEHVAGATPEPPDSRGSACRLRGDKRAAPEAIMQGDQVEVQLQIGGECPNAAPRADIMLAIDRSGSMNASGNITATRNAAIAFIGAIDLARDRVGVVSFNDRAHVVQPLTNDRAMAELAVRRIYAVGGTNIADAITVSSDELFGPNGRPDTQGVIVLLTDGRDTEPDGALQASANAKADGARLFTIGFGDVDPMVMALSASTPEQYYYAPDTSTLTAIYTEIAQRITADVLATAMTVIDELPQNMRYVTGSAQPTASWDASARTLTWQLTDVPFEGITLSYDVEPTQLGLHPTNVQAYSDYTDGLQWQGHLRFPVPEVNVLDKNPTPTPTFTPFPTSTPRPTVVPEPLFLPIVVKLKCRDQAVHADVALVMDISSSMLETSSEGGPTKLSAAVGAARTFVQLLALPGDQATIVTFDQDSRLEQPLTNDAAALLGTLDRIEAGRGTRIDLGIETAHRELMSERAVPVNNKVMVLLTDGRPTGEGADAQAVRDRAAGAKLDAILLYTIGLGLDVDVELLAEVATKESYAFQAPTSDELEDIYRAIAYTIECPNLTWP